MPPIVEAARNLRREMIYPKLLLWQRLRGSPMGVRFGRQHPVGLDHAADFYCTRAKLVTKIDELIHEQPEIAARDAVRENYLHAHGLTMLRIKARDGGGPPPQHAGEDQE